MDCTKMCAINFSKYRIYLSDAVSVKFDRLYYYGEIEKKI